MKSAIFVQWEQCADDKQNKFVEQLNKKNCTLSPLPSANQTEVTRHQFAVKNSLIVGEDGFAFFAILRPLVSLYSTWSGNGKGLATPSSLYID
ncbi:hypothetical protein T05_3414 [Trichinella murrelli]|uniref:Uncharacterized protein n=1 Tax=Trichinella murrelli TaxID=144512 RepID=A0A0V0TU91_9BILA|nr:hypothetical protein T05_3414 [Trichinella murrelli]